jgi:ankyrin repeat protein/serine/threonine protein kinase
MEESPRCLSCNSPPVRGRAGGLCPACLLRAALAGGPGRRGGGWPPPSPEELAALFPGLEIVALIGCGGMGAVYQVRQPALGRFAALKILPAELGGLPGFSKRFNHEARAQAALNHPHIVTIHEFGERDGLFFILMEFVPGGDLGAAIRAALPGPAAAREIIAQACDALQCAHDAGVVHRDIKPGNLLLDASGRVKVADFGIAEMVGAGEDPAAAGEIPCGTPEYMAPEQRGGTAPVDHRADIYSLGLVYHELLTGRLPDGQAAPDPARLEAATAAVLRRALEPDPQRRFQQAGEFRAALERAARGRGPVLRGMALAALAAVLAAAFAIPRRDPQPAPSGPPDSLPPAWENSLGMRFRPLPGGPGKLSVWETRVRDWQAFESRAPGRAANPPAANPATLRPDDPVAGCDAASIREFCEWLTQVERSAGRIAGDEAYRLPSDREWSQAAGLDEPQDASPADLHARDRSRYPWGTLAPAPAGAGNYADAALRESLPNAVVIPLFYDGHRFAAPVGSFAPDRHGFHDLGGNLWEAVTTGEAGNETLVFRGGSWLAGSSDGDWTCLLASYRAPAAVVSAFESGFRLMLAKTGSSGPAGLLDFARAGDPAGLRAALAAGADPAVRDAAGRTALHLAAGAGHREAVAALIAAGADADASDKEGYRPLHGAAAAGDPPVVEMLVQAGARTKTRTRVGGIGPAHLAARANRTAVLEVLAGHGADLRAGDQFGSQPLHYAVANRAREAVALLAARGIPMDAPGFGKVTPLGLAALQGDEETCALLLRLGAAANPLPAGQGVTPLAAAAWAAHPGCVELLLAHGADPRAPGVGIAAGTEPAVFLLGLKQRASAGAGRMPLILQPTEPGNRAESIRLLAAAGLDLAQTDERGMTPLLNAAFRGSTEAVQTFLELGADPEAADKQGFTALHSAAEQGFPKVVDLLLGKGAAVDRPNQAGLTALDCAAMQGGSEIAARLLAAGAGVNGLPEAPATPLFAAARLGRPAVLALLLEHGADPDAGSKPLGITPLMMAAGGIALKNASAAEVPAGAPVPPHGTDGDYLECLKLLLAGGALPQARARDGSTALHVAADHNQPAALLLLLDAGLDPDVPDHQLFRPMHRAAQRDSADAARLLLERGARPSHPLNPTTALHVAAATGAVNTAIVLLENGADPDARDGKGITPLHWAAAKGHAAIVTALAARGADLAARDFAYNTPLHAAVAAGQAAAVQALLEAGASRTLRNLEGATAQDLAKHLRFSEISSLLSTPTTPTPP